MQIKYKHQLKNIHLSSASLTMLSPTLRNNDYHQEIQPKSIIPLSFPSYGIR